MTKHPGGSIQVSYLEYHAAKTELDRLRAACATLTTANCDLNGRIRRLTDINAELLWPLKIVNDAYRTPAGAGTWAVSLTPKHLLIIKNAIVETEKEVS